MLITQTLKSKQIFVSKVKLNSEVLNDLSLIFSVYSDVLLLLKNCFLVDFGSHPM